MRRGLAGLLHFQVVNFEMTAVLIIAEEERVLSTLGLRSYSRPPDFFHPSAGPFRLGSLFAFLVPRPYNCHIWTRRDASTAESNIVARPFISSDELRWDRCALQSSASFDDWEFNKFSRLKLKTPQQERLQYN